MTRYPNEGVERFDRQFAESEGERNDRLARKRKSGVTMLGAPAEWKTHHRRWKCPECGVEGWSLDGSMPDIHDAHNGRECRPRGDPTNPANLSKESRRILRDEP